MRDVLAVPRRGCFVLVDQMVELLLPDDRVGHLTYHPVRMVDCPASARPNSVFAFPDTFFKSADQLALHPPFGVRALSDPTTEINRSASEASKISRRRAPRTTWWRETPSADIVALDSERWEGTSDIARSRLNIPSITRGDTDENRSTGSPSSKSSLASSSMTYSIPTAPELKKSNANRDVDSSTSSPGLSNAFNPAIASGVRRAAGQTGETVIEPCPRRTDLRGPSGPKL